MILFNFLREICYVYTDIAPLAVELALASSTPDSCPVAMARCDSPLRLAYAAVLAA